MKTHEMGFVGYIFAYSLILLERWLPAGIFKYSPLPSALTYSSISANAFTLIIPSG